MNNTKLSIIVPTYNEEITLFELIAYIEQAEYPVPYEILIIDDASIDRSLEIASLEILKDKTKSHIRFFKNKVNHGKGYSVRRGIKEASGTIIIIQDADREYNPQDIPKLLEPILSGEVDVVYGSRFLKNFWPKGMALPNLLANIFLTRLTNFLFKIKLTDMETCYKVFRADIVKSLVLSANRFDFEPEVTAMLTKRGIKIKELPIPYHGRSVMEGKKIRLRDFFMAVRVLWKLRIHRPQDTRHRK